MLRQLRAEAGLTQEELAEAAGLSPRSVSDLERGINRTARKDTAVLLSGALGRVAVPREGPSEGMAGSWGSSLRWGLPGCCGSCGPRLG